MQGPFIDITFADDRNGWAAFARADGVANYTTQDGGMTWTRCAESAVAPFQVFMRTPGVAFGMSLVEGEEETAVHVSRSVDGGCSWSILSTIRGFRAIEGSDIFFVSDTVGWIVQSNPGQVLRTVDGGVRWERAAIGSGERPRHVYFSDRDHGWIIANGADTPGFWSTSDGGRNWAVEDESEASLSSVPKSWRAGQLLVMLRRGR